MFKSNRLTLGEKPKQQNKDGSSRRPTFTDQTKSVGDNEEAYFGICGKIHNNVKCPTKKPEVRKTNFCTDLLAKIKRICFSRSQKKHQGPNNGKKNDKKVG